MGEYARIGDRLYEDFNRDARYVKAAAEVKNGSQDFSFLFPNEV